MAKAKKQKRHYPAGEQAKALGGALLDWFAVHQRDLPWRRSRDPYRIWVSEVMLQQTRVETVIPYYQRWFAQFPTLTALAEAPEDQVLKAWEGLGYYSRARNLHAAVKEVVSRYGGELPADPEAIRALKGVGPYTAGAVLSIAFNLPEPAVDGNVMRVLSRLYRIEDDIMQPATREGMEILAQQLIPEGQAWAFNQALMELGAMVCTPTSPSCLICPVAAYCRGREEGAQDRLPVKTKAKAPRPVDMLAGVVVHEGRVLIRRRPADGLLGGLWEFPGGERPADLTWEAGLHHLFGEQFGMRLVLEQALTPVKHVFSHLIWDLRAYVAYVDGAPPDRQQDDLRWVEVDKLTDYAYPVAHRKVLAEFLGCASGSIGLQ